MGSGTLEISELRKDYGSVAAVAGVSLAVEEGEMVALLGPSGCGKTTTLRMVSGLEVPTSGEIRVGGRCMSSAGRATAPERRGMGMVFQSYALWPHMTVFKNVAFGLRMNKVPRQEIETRVSAALRTVDMAAYGDRYVTQLSGGQQQRIALARALATEPSILLLDEPLSNLDAALREVMRFEIREVQQRLGITSLYVTHSQDEALALADRVAVMRDGLLVQVGPPDQIYARPVDRFVAGVIGIPNVVHGVFVGAEGETAAVLAGGHRLRAQSYRDPSAPGTVVDVLVRPERIQLRPAVGDEAAPGTNTVPGRIERASFMGSSIDYVVELDDPGQFLRVQGKPPIVARPGDRVDLEFMIDDTLLLGPHQVSEHESFADADIVGRGSDL